MLCDCSIRVSVGVRCWRCSSADCHGCPCWRDATAYLLALHVVRVRPGVGRVRRRVEADEVPRLGLLEVALEAEVGRRSGVVDEWQRAVWVLPVDVDRVRVPETLLRLRPELASACPVGDSQTWRSQTCCRARRCRARGSRQSRTRIRPSGRCRGCSSRTP
jgi:hypothetical protein